jgi:hypothetical protein
MGRTENFELGIWNLEFVASRLRLRRSRAGWAFFAARFAATLLRLFLMIVVTIAISSLPS